MSKEIKYIHKIGDKTFLFETYEQPLRTQIEQLKQQLSEKDKEIEKYRNASMIVVGRRSQGKKHLMQIKIKELQNQTAIRELEKVKEYNRGLVYSSSLIDKFIDKQIKELRGEENE